MENVRGKKLLIESVKSKLDNSTWDFQYSGSRGNDSHLEKAIKFLERTRFSVQSIVAELEECYDGVLYNAKSSDVHSWNEFVELATSMVADSLAQNKIKRYGWKIGESVSFNVC